jgi:hypothetical protein
MNRDMLRCLFLSLCLAGLTQAQVNAPRIGFARFGDGSLRAVYGLQASFVLGKPVLQSVTAASFSDDGGLVATPGHIQLLSRDGSVVSDCESTDPAPVLNMDGDGSTAVAWLPASQTILHWEQGMCQSVSLPAPLTEHVTSISVAGHVAKLLAIQDNAVSEIAIGLDSGNRISERFLPDVKAPGIKQKGMVLFRGENGLELISPAGAHETVPLSAPDLQIERIAADWIHLSSRKTNQHWVLHLTGPKPHLSELPSPVASPAAAVLVRGEQ